MNNEFYIKFDTTVRKGSIEATKVTIENVTITDLNKVLPIDLTEHPLYSDLEDYVHDNPSGR